MKKLFVSMFAVAAALFATSCTNESLEQYDVVGDSNVTFTVTSPELATRAYYGDGDEAQDLYYGVYVYSADGTTKQLLPNISKTTTPVKMENLTAKVQLQLVKGKKYDIIFWAENEKNDAVTVDWAAQTMTYAPQAANVEAYDSFWATKTVEVTGPMTDDVYLYRPFAQINIGTDDVQAAANAGLVVNETALGVAGVYSSMNLFDGKVDATATATFAQAALPTAGQFPVAGYEYLSMNYVLVGDAKSLSTVTFQYYEAGNLTPYEAVYTNVPVQRNYRTNIYGSILTDPYDIKVEIKPEWEDELPGGEMANTVFDALYYGGEVVLTEDVTLRGFVTVTKNATIDLNGHTLTYEYNPDALNGSAIMARVENGATLTFKGAGKVESNYYIASANAGGTIVVEGTADYVANITTFQANGGKVYIKGGKFSVTNGDATYLLNHIDSQKNNGLIEVTGGHFCQFNPADNKAENPQMSFVPAGLQVEEDDDWFHVFKPHKTLEELVNAVNNEDEMNLVNPIDNGSNVVAVNNNDAVWNFYGNEYKGGGQGTNNYAFNVSGSDIIVNDANLNGAGFAVLDGSSVTVNDSTIAAHPGKSGRNMFYVVGNSTVTVDEGTYTFDRNSCYFVYVEAGSTCYIKGGHFEKPLANNASKDSFVNNASAGTVIITGGTFNVDPTKWLADGYKATKSGKIWTVTAE